MVFLLAILLSACAALPNAEAAPSTPEAVNSVSASLPGISVSIPAQSSTEPLYQVEAKQTSMYVRSPAGRPFRVRSNPMMPPNIIADRMRTVTDNSFNSISPTLSNHACMTTSEIVIRSAYGRPLKAPMRFITSSYSGIDGIPPLFSIHNDASAFPNIA